MTEFLKQKPVRKDLWGSSAGTGKAPRLLASHCKGCRELFFPIKANGICTYCQSRELEEVQLSRYGHIYSLTVVMQKPPLYYKGEVPYALGFVELSDGIRVETLFTDCEPDELRVGMPVEMVLRPLHVDEDQTEILAYKFRPMDLRKEEE